MDTYFVNQMISAIPELAVWGVGAVLCLRWSRRRPITAAMLGVALLIQVTRRVAIFYSPEISNFFQAMFAGDRTSFLAMYLTFGVTNAIGWGLLLGALAREFSADRAFHEH